MTPTFWGMTNIRNESRWIERCLSSMLSFCDLIVVYDDNSTDDTVAKVQAFGERIVLMRSEFRETDKTRDKNLMYGKLLQYIPYREQTENHQQWVVAIDGDEELIESAPNAIRECISKSPQSYCISCRVLYHWNSLNMVRTDGVYSQMNRPSLFRVINPSFKFQPTGFPMNLHCSNVPQELLWKCADSKTIIRHYGYLDKETRLAKWKRNISRHPDAIGEDYYRHCVMGDIPSVLATDVTKHAGPLTLVPSKEFFPCP